MAPPAPRFTVEVLHGRDRGLRVDLTGEALTIGRGSDRDLVLTDMGVSRKHIEITATERGVLFVVGDGAAPVVIDGRPVTSIEVSPGTSVLVGSTLLGVRFTDGDAEPLSQPGPVDVYTVLDGAGADAVAMGALHKLIEVADITEGRGALLEATVSWGRDLTPSCSVALLSGESARRDVLEHQRGDDTVIVIPAPADDALSLSFCCRTGGRKLTESFRRMLLVACRIFGSAFMRLGRNEVAEAEVATLRALSFGTSRGFLGNSPEAKKLAQLIPRLALSESTVLLDGETGTGKTFVARLLHEQGPRARQPFRVINCAAIPESLIESELFGHERGSFTGAVAQRIGAFETAGRGTIFLDEIGELPLASQAKLLRVLEERRFERVGSNALRAMDARVIAATNRDLTAMIAAKQFRSDLFYRISVVTLSVPPLRDRGEDRVLLAEQLLRDAAQTADRRVSGFREDAVAAIRRYSWPGNVRELRNAIEHAIAIGEGGSITAADFPAGIGRLVSVAPPAEMGPAELPLTMAELQRRGVQVAMRYAEGNQVRAAALLGVSRTTLRAHLAAAAEKPEAGS